MKKMLLLLLCFLLILCGCASNEDPTGTIPPVIPDSFSTEATAPMTALAAVSVPVSTETFCLEDGTELFSYTSQHMNLIFPNASVADKVTLEFLNRVDKTVSESENTLQLAQADYPSAEQWIPYFYQVIYSPTRIDHGVLSLFGTQNSYSGGMHGNVSCVSANYDMMTGDILTLGSIMHADASTEDFIEIVLRKLEAAADGYYLYDDYEVAVRERLGGDENLYEDFYFTQTGLSFYFSPYEIAPYASGIITVEIPYSELPGLIYDGYFPAERQQVQGSLAAAMFMQTDMEQFNNMAEVKLSEGEDLHVIYPRGSVEDIRITVSGDGRTMPDYTVFAALEMSDKDAVVLSIPEALQHKIMISYQSGGEASTMPLV